MWQRAWSRKRREGGMGGGRRERGMRGGDVYVSASARGLEGVRCDGSVGALCRAAAKMRAPQGAGGGGSGLWVGDVCVGDVCVWGT